MTPAHKLRIVDALLQTAVVHLGFLNLAFGTALLAPDQWWVCVAMASGVLWFSELRKGLSRFWGQRNDVAGAV